MSTQNNSTTDVARKREAILQQAIATFAEEGYRHTDVQVIADRAGVGKGTVYRYFGHKEDLFWASTLAVFTRLRQHLIAAVDRADGALEQLRVAGRAYAQFFEANPQYLEIFVQERAQFRGVAPESHVAHHEKLIDRFADVIEEGIAAGELRPLHVRKTVIALGSVLYGSVVNACYDGFGQTLTESAEYSVEVFLEGLRAEPARNQQETGT